MEYLAARAFGSLQGKPVSLGDSVNVIEVSNLMSVRYFRRNTPTQTSHEVGQQSGFVFISAEDVEQTQIDPGNASLLMQSWQALIEQELGFCVFKTRLKRRAFSKPVARRQHPRAARVDNARLGNTFKPIKNSLKRRQVPCALLRLGLARNSGRVERQMKDGPRTPPAQDALQAGAVRHIDALHAPAIVQ
jgi:hypothetical protein